MAEGFNHAKSTVKVGDGFKFLADYKNEFDVIITDSSDPEGPAESLFKKPYFQLLHGALREGGVITTQGCTSQFSLLWKVERSLGSAASRPDCQWLSGRPQLLGTARGQCRFPQACSR